MHIVSHLAHLTQFQFLGVGSVVHKGVRIWHNGHRVVWFVVRYGIYGTTETMILCGLLCFTVYMAQRTPCCVVCCALRYVWHSRHPVVCFFVRYDRPIYGAADTVLCGLLCVAAAVYDTADTVMLCGLLCKRDIWHSWYHDVVWFAVYNVIYGTPDTVMLCGLLCITWYMAHQTRWCCVVCCV